MRLLLDTHAFLGSLPTIRISAPSRRRDPFDRLIISQAIVEHFTLIGADPEFDAYAITRRW
jgi:PIN domain nuclease of toxin-antitoxin system